MSSRSPRALREQAHQGDFALEGAEAFVIEAELEGAALVEFRVFARPHFAEAAGAEQLGEMPAGAARDFQPDGGTPAERFLLAGADGAFGFFAIGRGDERGEALGADLEDLDRVRRGPSSGRDRGPASAAAAWSSRRPADARG